jgi:hypothetical protein
MASKKKLRKQVRKDVRSAYRPVFKALRNERQGLKREEDVELGRVANIYSKLAESLGGMVPQNAAANQGVLQGVQGALGSISGAGMDPAMAKALGTMGAGFAANLGSQALASQSGVASGIAAGGMQGADAEARVIERYKQNLNDIQTQIHGAKADRAGTFLEELNRRREFGLAKREQELRAEQFEKEFGFKKNQTAKANRQDRKAKQWVLTQAEQEALDKKRKQWRRQVGIPDLRAQVGTLKEQLASLSSQGLDPTQYKTEYAALNDELKQVQAELKRKRNRVKRKTKRYRKKVGS